jgi:SAM-dependent methyltransferase
MTEPARNHGLRRRLWRMSLRLRYQVLRRRHRRLVLERVDGIPIVVLPDVFNPVLFRTGAFLARNLEAPSSSERAHQVESPSPSGGGPGPSAHASGALVPGERLRRQGGGLRALDVGTGSGIGAIFAARHGYDVIGIDRNPEAVRCARINVLLNNLEGRIDICHGDLFTPVAGAEFDLVLFNPPFYRGVPTDPMDQAWRGTDVIERFAAGLAGALRPSGEARVVLSTDGEWRAMLSALDAAGFGTRPVASKDFGNEIITVYAARRRVVVATSAAAIASGA